MRFASLVFLAAASSARGLDWHVRNHTTLRNQAIVVNGSIFLEAGGILEVHNCTLSVLNTFDRQFNFTWRGGGLRSYGSTIGGHLTSSGICFHTNIFVYEGWWVSVNDTVRCSYGILFDEDSVGTLDASGLTAGISPDSIIMGGRGNVSLRDSLFSLNIGLHVAPATHVSLDLPSKTPMTRVIQPAGSLWRLALTRTTSTHWFVELMPVLSASSTGANAVFTFSPRTSPFNLHLHTQSLDGSFSVHHRIDRPVTVGNVELRSAGTPVRVAAYEIYATTSHANESLRISGIERGGENMLFGPGTLELVGTGRDNSSIACTTCNVGGRGSGSGHGTLRVRHATIGYLGGALVAQVLIRGGGGKFDAEDVTINDLNVLAEGKASIFDASDCHVAGKVQNLGGGGGVNVACDQV
jgi:hypothetical protein